MENARWADEGHTGITLGDTGSFIPVGHSMLEGIDLSTIGEYVGPPTSIEDVPSVISRSQFAQVMGLDKVLSEDDAFNLAASAKLPDVLLSALNKLPAGDRFAVKMALARVDYERAHPAVPVLGQLLINPLTNKPYDGPALDEVWRRGAKL